MIAYWGRIFREVAFTHSMFHFNIHFRSPNKVQKMKRYENIQRRSLVPVKNEPTSSSQGRRIH